MSSQVHVDEEIDCRGLSCPLPIIKTKKAIDGMQAGQVLKMLATDPGSINDMAAWVSKTGNEMVDREEGEGIYTYYIRKVG
ncbi:MAG: sulfurtransferase TusA family protein [Nitrospirota bacterium]|nr:sulfurtransferase TusA family protein [Nitrospirota bacterium]